LLNLASTPTNVIIVDFTKSILFNLSEAEFAALQKVVDTAKTLLWATAGGLLSGQNPECAMASGMMRVIRAEQVSIDAITVDFDPETTTTMQAAEDIAFKADRQIQGNSPVEHEYCVSDGITYISRLLPNAGVNASANIDSQQLQDTTFDPDMHLEGRIQAGKVVFEETKEISDLTPDSLEVKLSLAGLNRESVQVINGSDISTVFSHEIAGTVERIGNSVQGLAIGDRVVGLNLGALSNHQIVSDIMVQKVHDDESLAEMVSLLMPYATALHGLKSLAGVQRGEKVLILESTGLVSGAAIEVCYLLGAMPYVVVSGKDEAQSVLQRHSVGKDQIFSSQQELLAFLRRYDNGSDIDVVFSSGWTSETTAREAWRSISAFGRFVNHGRKKVLERGAIDPVPFHRGANYHAFDIVDVYKRKPVVVSNLLKEIVKLYRERRIAVPQPLVVKNISEINESVTSFQDTFKVGKTVFEYENSEKKIHLIPYVPETRLRSDGTYLLVGCLGGLGRSLTSWMLQKGARHFCFLSRSGADSKSASQLVRDLEASGAVVTIVRGDVSVLADVERAISGISSSRPLRGVIHAAMVLRVRFVCIAWKFEILTLPIGQHLPGNEVPGLGVVHKAEGTWCCEPSCSSRPDKPGLLPCN
jgi:NADPH:quinone reductase-like Zn-dependent oxidoreductase